MIKRSIYFLTIALFLGMSVYFMWDAHRLYTALGSIKGQRITSFLFPFLIAAGLGLVYLRHKSFEPAADPSARQSPRVNMNMNTDSNANPYASESENYSHEVKPKRRGTAFYVLLSMATLSTALLFKWSAVWLSPQFDSKAEVNPVFVSILTVVITPMVAVLFSLFSSWNRDSRSVAQIVFGTYALIMIVFSADLIAALLSR